MEAWVEIAKAIGSVSFGAVLTQIFMSQKNRRGATFLSLRISVELERFADRCLEVISEIELYEASQGCAGSQRMKLPDAPVFPSDDDGWRALKQRLAERALTLLSKIDSSQRSINFIWNVTDADETVDACRDACGERGWEALVLARELRKSYRLPEFISPCEQHLRDIVENIAHRKTK